MYKRIHIPLYIFSAPFFSAWDLITPYKWPRSLKEYVAYKRKKCIVKPHSFIWCLCQLKLHSCVIEQTSWWQSAEFSHHFRFLQEFHLQHSFLFLALGQCCVNENFHLKVSLPREKGWKHQIFDYSSWIWNFASVHY